MSSLWAGINRHFGQGARVSWFDRSYFVDWLVVGGLWFLSGVIKVSPVFERRFHLSDDDISYPHKKNQVGGFVNNLIALFVPLGAVLICGALRRSLFVIHHGSIGILATRGLSQVITEFLKHSVGRLRPDFLARCKWDKAIKECTGKASTVLDGRKSFPSGHSSTAFSGMVFLSLFIAGQTAAWAFSVPKAPRSISRLAAISATLFPIFWAMHVALTRIQDYRHHKEDVIVGSIIGIFSAVVCYLVFWPNPFTKGAFQYNTQGQPRLLYSEGEQEYTTMGAADFELNRFEDEENRG